MKIHIGYAAGPSTGLILSGTKTDLQELGRQVSIAAEAFSAEEGSLRLSDVDATGESVEWLEFRVVRDVEPLVTKSHQIAVRRFRYAPIALGLGVVVLYFAFRGVVAVFR